jgi:hypothetical protein
MNRRRYRLEVPAVSDRFIAAFHMRDDDRRRWWVIDTQPSPEAKVGTTVAECLGEGKALEVARALNRGADVEAAVEAVTTPTTVCLPVADARRITQYLQSETPIPWPQDIGDIVARIHAAMSDLPEPPPGVRRPSIGDRVRSTVDRAHVGEIKWVDVARMVADVVWDGADRTMTVPWRELTIDRPDPTRVIREGINPDEEPF